MKLTIALETPGAKGAMLYVNDGVLAEQWVPLLQHLLEGGALTEHKAQATAGPQPTHIDSGGQLHVYVGRARLRTTVLLGEQATVEVYRNAASGELFARRADDWTKVMERAPGSYGAPEAGHGLLDGHTDGKGGGGALPQHPDDEAVDRFAAALKQKLAQKRREGRGGWQNPDECKVGELADALMRHTFKGDPVDVGNFAMMLHQRAAPNHVLGLAAERAAKQHVGAAVALQFDEIVPARGAKKTAKKVPAAKPRKRVR